VVDVLAYGTASCDDLLQYVAAHTDALGEDTVHLCLMVWLGNDFTQKEGKNRVGAQKARKFEENPDRVKSAALALGPLLDCFDGVWFLWPGSSEIWSTESPLDVTAKDFIDCMWRSLISDRAERPDFRRTYYALDSVESLYKSLTRADGWHADFTVVNANRLGRYVLSVF
jgi:hypothetical protein